MNSPSDPAKTFEVGDVVFTLDDEFAREWFHNWPGVIKSLTRGGRDAVVEFMGFGDIPHRKVTVSIGALQHLENPEIGAKINRILRQLQTPDAKGRQTLFKRVEPKVSRELHDDEDDEMLH